MRFLYTAGIYLYVLVIRVVSIWNPKARKWLDGRKDLFAGLEKASATLQNPVWFHCASLGEFEQGRPLLEAMKKEHPSQKILLTFYSPSGFEIRKDYPLADYVCYLPLDTPSNARRFLDIVKPSSVFIVKYEFWFNLLTEIGNRKIPAYLVSGMFRKEQIFFKWYGSWFRERLNTFHRFYVQDEDSARLLSDAGFKNTLVTGDTRFDRVLEIAAQAQEIPVVKQFCNNKPVLIAGSSWAPEEKMLAELHWKEAGYKLIIAPHEIAEEHIASILALFSDKASVVRYSQAGTVRIEDADVLLIDNVGMLSSLYRYGRMALIGGGFGEGIHNILEPAVSGLPVFFGPRYEKFMEAKELIEKGGAFCINDSADFKQQFNKMIKDPSALQTASEIAARYVKEKSGAVGKILNAK
jgi:3-deoxy-D-manno-octulosonic-acid transferase